MQRRRLTITLDGSQYRALERLAKREQRATDQEASYLLGSLLSEAAPLAKSASATNHVASTAARVPDHE